MLGRLLLKRANSTGAPANRAGFLLFNRLEDILPKSQNNNSISNLINGKPNTVKMNLHKIDCPDDAGKMPFNILDYAVKQYCNQEPFRAIDVIRGRPPLMITSPLTGLPIPFETTDDSAAMECHSVLKWRKRRMRGHKHKKRLRKNRYKSKK